MKYVACRHIATQQMSCLYDIQLLQLYHCQGGYVFVSVWWFVCLSVSRITRKVVDNFFLNICLQTRNNYFDFGNDLDPSPNSGVFLLHLFVIYRGVYNSGNLGSLLEFEIAPGNLDLNGSTWKFFTMKRSLGDAAL